MHQIICCLQTDRAAERTSYQKLVQRETTGWVGVHNLVLICVACWCRRTDNLQARVTAKAEKKKAKREKKLLRPGFEGRRSGFIPSPGGGGGGGS